MHAVYLDHAATTPLRPEVRDALVRALDEHWGNPSSVHARGRDARGLLDEARARLAAVLGADAAEVVFTRGGTESANLAVLGRARAMRGAPVACSTIEHKAVLGAAKAAAREGSPLRLLPADSQGVISPQVLEAVLPERPALVSVMWANNEIGVVQPVASLAERCHAAGTVFHSDATQALGKLPVRLDQVPVDLLTVSAHKLGGPKGVGALLVRRGTELEPLVYGGGQERGFCPGTENVAGAVGFALAAELAEAERTREMARLGQLRDRLEAEFRERVPELVVHGAGAERLPSVLNISIPGVHPEMLLPALDLEGVACSSGSACSSGTVAPSHVLLALGVAAEIAGPSIRFSLGRTTTAAEIERVIEVVPAVADRLRAFVGL